MVSAAEAEEPRRNADEAEAAALLQANQSSRPPAPASGPPAAPPAGAESIASFVRMDTLLLVAAVALIAAPALVAPQPAAVRTRTPASPPPQPRPAALSQ